ncbi:MAG: ribosome-binding factor A [Parcubacteria group bacterium]|nr:ribosome-binding factor A [Parcubacteria group bacterium]
MSLRTIRVNELIHEEVGKILAKDVILDGNYLITITTVETSRDLRHSTIRYSVLPDSAVKEVEKFLEGVVGEVQHILNRRLKMHPIPRLEFVYDPREREAAHIEQLLEQNR